MGQAQADDEYEYADGGKPIVTIYDGRLTKNLNSVLYKLLQIILSKGLALAFAGIQRGW